MPTSQQLPMLDPPPSITRESHLETDHEARVFQCFHGAVPRSLTSGSDKPAWCPLGNGGDGEPTTETRR